MATAHRPSSAVFNNGLSYRMQQNILQKSMTQVLENDKEIYVTQLFEILLKNVATKKLKKQS